MYHRIIIYSGGGSEVGRTDPLSYGEALERAPKLSRPDKVALVYDFFDDAPGAAPVAVFIGGVSRTEWPPGVRPTE